MTPRAPKYDPPMPDDHQGLGTCLDPGGRRLDAGELLPVVVPGQMDPAGELSTGAAAALELFLRPLQAGRQDLLIGQGQKRL